MTIFTYGPLDLDCPTFRLLRLHRGSGLDIECELFQASFENDDIIPYDALSYTWGGTDLTATVHVNGRTLGVTENLYLALQYLRSREVDRILWIDAVCIDQSNTQERGHQVKQMGSIYSRADRVIFWLGGPTDDTDILMDSLKLLEREKQQLECVHWRLKDQRWVDLWSTVQLDLMSRHANVAARQRNGLVALLDSPWFRRVWILQEVANARSALVCSGTKSISARFFALAPALTKTVPKSHCQAVLDIMPGPWRRDSWWGQKQDLYTLLLKFRDSKAGDPRDMVYALLGISSDAQELRADYGKTTQQVFQDAISFIFGLPDYHCNTTSDFLNFKALNSASLARLASTADVHRVKTLFEQRGEDIPVTEEVLVSAAGNENHGAEVIRLLCENRKSAVSTKDILVAAAKNTRCGAEIMKFFFDSHAPPDKSLEEVAAAAAGNISDGAEIIKILHTRWNGTYSSERSFEAAVENAGCGAEVFRLLRQKDKPSQFVLRRITRNAASNMDCGAQMAKLLLGQVEDLTLEAAAGGDCDTMMFLLNQMEGGVKITSNMFTEAVGNMEFGVEMLELLFQWQTRPVMITTTHVEGASRNNQCGAQVMKLLLEKRVADFEITTDLIGEVAHSFDPTCMKLLITYRGGDMQITRKVVNLAAGNGARWEIMDLLLEHCVDGFSISPELIIALALRFRGRHLELLLQCRRKEVKITEYILKAVLKDTGRNGKGAVVFLLQHTMKDIPITEELVKIAASNTWYGTEVMEALLNFRPDEVVITEEVLEVASGNHGDGVNLMGFLLRRPRMPHVITEKIMIAAVANSGAAKRLMELFIARQAHNVAITEKVIRAALENKQGGNDVVEYLVKCHTDKLVVTEGLLLELAGSFKPDLLRTLLEQRGDDVVVTNKLVLAAWESQWCSAEIHELLLGQLNGTPSTATIGKRKRGPDWWKRLKQRGAY